MTSLNIHGHYKHKGSSVLAVAENADRIGTDRMAEEAKDLCKFLQRNLPCGTLDRLAARLAIGLINLLQESDRLTVTQCGHVKAAMQEYIKEITP